MSSRRRRHKTTTKLKTAASWICRIVVEIVLRTSMSSWRCWRRFVVVTTPRRWRRQRRCVDVKVMTMMPTMTRRLCVVVRMLTSSWSRCRHEIEMTSLTSSSSRRQHCLRCIVVEQRHRRDDDVDANHDATTITSFRHRYNDVMIARWRRCRCCIVVTRQRQHGDTATPMDDEDGMSSVASVVATGFVSTHTTRDRRNSN